MGDSSLGEGVSLCVFYVDIIEITFSCTKEVLVAICIELHYIHRVAFV